MAAIRLSNGTLLPRTKLYHELMADGVMLSMKAKAVDEVSVDVAGSGYLLV